MQIRVSTFTLLLQSPFPPAAHPPEALVPRTRPLPAPRTAPSADDPDRRRRGFAATVTAPRNRGIVLDVAVTAVNALVMGWAADEFLQLGARASAGARGATVGMAMFFAGMLVLPTAGAVLKRWHFHEQRGARDEDAEPAALGCLLNPAFYLAVSLVVGMTAAVLVADVVYGDKLMDRADIFLPMVFGVMAAALVQTILVYRYVSPPQHPPRSAFLRGRASAMLGDACIFLNMMLFQVLWNVVLSASFERPDDLEGFAARGFFLWFAAILLYFPPRIFYLADDLRRPPARLSVLLATSSAILRDLLGG